MQKHREESITGPPPPAVLSDGYTEKKPRKIAYER